MPISVNRISKPVMFAGRQMTNLMVLLIAQDAAEMCTQMEVAAILGYAKTVHKK
jgi:hypothetical protein